MPQDTFTAVIRGFDVLVEASEDEGVYRVSVTEGSGVPWEIDIPVELDEFDGENEMLDGSNEILTYVSEAAVDLFEAQRDTLGEGAGALEVAAMKKRSYSDSMYWEPWFMKLKNTPFEEEGAQMLAEYFALDLEDEDFDSSWNDYYAAERKICYDLNMLNLERMKDTDITEIVIVIEAQCNPCSCFGGDDLTEFAERFIGHPSEARVLDKLKELLDLRDQRDSLDEDNGPAVWERRQTLERQMQDLALTALQQNVMEMPETGIEAAPNMAGDLAQLMEGVDLSMPLAAGVRELKGTTALEPGRPTQPTPIPGPVQQGDMRVDQGPGDEREDFPSKLSDSDPMGRPVEEGAPVGGVGTLGDAVNIHVQPRKATGDVKRAFEEIESSDERVEELGHIRNDRDPALIDSSQFSFNQNERVELKEEIEHMIGWGMKKVFPKGTKGYTESQYDKAGDRYVMRTDDNHLLTVRWDQIKSIPK